MSVHLNINRRQFFLFVRNVLPDTALRAVKVMVHSVFALKGGKV